MGGGGIKKDAQLDCKFGVARGSRNHVILMDRGSKDPADSKTSLQNAACVSVDLRMFPNMRNMQLDCKFGVR